ncbi:glycosyltransferase family 2 protein [Lachnospiraceae bacterium OttesenSCG-928-D06]|nr:glycosyltransferase family 2 protein [Lachnospiraceae bacterium OttesenSCG-928-D06]
MRRDIMGTVDIIIPTYKPDKRLFTIIEQLEKQTIPVHNIIIMNTEEKYLETLIYGTAFFEKHKSIKVFHLSKREFDHGKTRHIGVQKSEADFFVMLTQDAVPADEYLLANLLRNLEGSVAVSYARQLPEEGCNEIERFSRAFNYPEQSRIKTMKDIEELGIKTFFCSNVCAAYRREVYDELGGFIKHTIFNEDMIFAAEAIKNGYAVSYEADAKVIHSHNYSGKKQFHRNFDNGVSQADHPELFQGVPAESEGKRLVSSTAKYLKEKGLGKEIPGLYWQSACKYLGFKLGKQYNKLPKSFVRKVTMNKAYWDHESRRRDALLIDPAKGYGTPDSER